MKDKDLFICSAYQHILLSLIKATNYTIQPDIIILDWIDCDDVFLRRLKESQLFDNVLYIKGRFFFKPRNFWQKNIVGYFCARKYLSTFIPSVNIKQYKHIYIYHDWSWISLYLKYCRIKYNIIEDGIDYFKVVLNSGCACLFKKPPLKRRIFNFIFPNNVNNLKFYQKCHLVKSIEINDFEGTCFTTKRKIVVKPKIEYYALFENTNILNEILKVFYIDHKISETDNGVIIFTRCFEDDGILKPGEEVELYEKLIDRFKGFDIFIKKHPRDNSNLSLLEKSCTIIEKNFPGELLRYAFDKNIKYYVTIGSSVVITFPKDKVISWNTIDEFLNS